MNFKTEKPLGFFDCETTGVDLGKDKIVSIALVTVDLVKKKMKKKSFMFNPGFPIPKEATDIHGITDEMVKDCPSFEENNTDIAEFLNTHIPAGYNINTFDIPLVKRELMESGIDVSFMNEPTFKTVDIFRIVKKLYKRSLSDMYLRYTGKELSESHDALADTIATYELMVNMFKQEDLPDNVDALNEFYYDEKFDSIKRADISGKLIFNKDGKVVYNFGKHKGKLVSDPDEDIRGYADWIMKSPDKFTEEVIQIIKKEVKQ